MKSKVMIVILILLSIILLSIFNVKYPYSYKENVLYSQNDVKGYHEKEAESDNLVNRNEAIKIAKYYIEDVLGNDLDAPDIKMYVNLYKNDSSAESYYWNISWSSSTISCGVEIKTINGQINNIYVNKDFNQYINNGTKYHKLTKNEFLDIVDEFIVALGIDLDSYDLTMYDMNENKQDKFCTFTNKKNKDDKFLISISKRGRFITRYSTNPLKENL